eukprot:62439_1
MAPKSVTVAIVLLQLSTMLRDQVVYHYYHRTNDLTNDGLLAIVVSVGTLLWVYFTNVAGFSDSLVAKKQSKIKNTDIYISNNQTHHYNIKSFITSYMAFGKSIITTITPLIILFRTTIGTSIAISIITAIGTSITTAISVSITTLIITSMLTSFSLTITTFITTFTTDISTTTMRAPCIEDSSRTFLDDPTGENLATSITQLDRSQQRHRAHKSIVVHDGAFTNTSTKGELITARAHKSIDVHDGAYKSIHKGITSCSNSAAIALHITKNKLNHVSIIGSIISNEIKIRKEKQHISASFNYTYDCFLKHLHCTVIYILALNEFVSMPY